MWLEVAEKTITCEKCNRKIIGGKILMRFGADKSAEAQVFFADCFESMSQKLRLESDALRLAEKIKPKEPVRQLVEVKCFTC